MKDGLQFESANARSGLIVERKNDEKWKERWGGLLTVWWSWEIGSKLRDGRGSIFVRWVDGKGGWKSKWSIVYLTSRQGRNLALFLYHVHPKTNSSCFLLWLVSFFLSRIFKALWHCQDSIILSGFHSTVRLLGTAKILSHYQEFVILPGLDRHLQDSIAPSSKKVGTWFQILFIDQ